MEISKREVNLVPNSIKNKEIFQMVIVLAPHPKSKSVDVTLSINDIFDLLNGLFILVGNKEMDITKYGGDSIDKEQLKRYQTLLAQMQRVKNLVK